MKKARKAVSILMAAVLAASVSTPASFAAGSPYVKSDTTMDFTVNKSNTYAFKFTVMGSHDNPKIAAGNGAVLQTESCHKVVEHGNDTYYFKVRAIGTPGQESAIYTTLPGQSGVRHCKIKVGVQSHKGDYNYYLNHADRVKQYFVDYVQANSACKYDASVQNTVRVFAEDGYIIRKNEYTTTYYGSEMLERILGNIGNVLIDKMQKANVTTFNFLESSGTFTPTYYVVAGTSDTGTDEGNTTTGTTDTPKLRDDVDAGGFHYRDFNRLREEYKEYFKDYVLQHSNLKYNPALDTDKGSHTEDITSFVKNRVLFANAGVKEFNPRPALAQNAEFFIREMKKHKSTEFGFRRMYNPGNYNYPNSDLDYALVYHPNDLDYDGPAPEPNFSNTDYYPADAAGGVNLGCSVYAGARAEEVTGMDNFVAYVNSNLTVEENMACIRSTGLDCGTVPKKNALVYEFRPDNSKYGHFEHWEFVEDIQHNKSYDTSLSDLPYSSKLAYSGTEGLKKLPAVDWVTVSGANTNESLRYYGRRTFQTAPNQDWKTFGWDVHYIFIYLT